VSIIDLQNMIRREAEIAVQKYAPAHRFGIVSQYNPAGHQVRVTFPEDLDANGNPQLSPWMPIVSPAASGDAGDVAAPLMGSQAMVIHFGYGADRFTFMLGTVRSAVDAVPSMPGAAANSGIPEGSRAIVHPLGGQGIYLAADGSVSVGLPGGTFKRLATEDFVLNSYNSHTHQIQNVASGSATLTTQAPAVQISTGDTTDLTVNLKAT
jgi:hypothetical protein